MLNKLSVDNMFNNQI